MTASISWVTNVGSTQSSAPPSHEQSVGGQKGSANPNAELPVKPVSPSASPTPGHRSVSSTDADQLMAVGRDRSEARVRGGQRGDVGHAEPSAP